MNSRLIYLLPAMLAFASCQTQSAKEATDSGPAVPQEESFAYDYGLLRDHSDVVLLERDSAKVAIVGKYQARVMTSTANGFQGLSYGWINHELIRSGAYAPHINAFGGEERFWLGPEGGQYALFFKKGDPFDFEHWQTPGFIDTMTYDLVEQQKERVRYQKAFDLVNYAGTSFKVSVDREIRLLDQAAAQSLIPDGLDSVRWVGYETVNKLTNEGTADWNKSTGVLSIWLLGMMKASAENTVVIPFKAGGAGQINDAYFGPVPAERLVKKDSVLYFTGDAHYRSKIGIPPAVVKPVAGSYDAQRGVLTILRFDYTGDTAYVNSMWEQQAFPYRGDVINSYNDGPNDTGSQLGAFYELETSSPAVALRKGETLTHKQQTWHFEGNPAALDRICRALLGVGLPEHEK